MTVTIAFPTEQAATSPISTIKGAAAAAAANSSHMTQPASTAEKGGCTSQQDLSISPPLESEYEAIAEIIRASFAISGKSVWLDCSIEECIQFRIAAMKHRNSLRILYDQGKISTPNRMMVARIASTGQVIGVAIWTLEDDLSDEAVQKREEEEARLSFPSAEIPYGANKDLWDRSMQAAEKAHDDHLGRRARCYVKYLCVDGKVQRSGAGTALMKVIRKDAGSRPIFLEAADTPPAVRFYTKLGFTKLEELHVDDLLYTAMILEPDTKSPLDEA